MKDRDVHPLAANPLDGKAIGGFDVFEVDGAERRLQCADDIGQFLGVCFIHFDIEAIDGREFLEEDSLAFHHRFGGQRTDVAQPEDSRSVADNSNKIAPRRIARCVAGIVPDFKAGFGHAGRIGPRQIAPIGHRLGRADLEFAGLGKFVVIQCGLAKVRLVGHDASL